MREKQNNKKKDDEAVRIEKNRLSYVAVSQKQKRSGQPTASTGDAEKEFKQTNRMGRFEAGRKNHGDREESERAEYASVSGDPSFHEVNSFDPDLHRLPVHTA